MADQTQTLVPNINPVGARATADLSTHQWKFVQVNDLGVSLADVRSQTACYVLGTKSTSGTNCELVTRPNVTRIMAGAAITRGFYVEPMSATGLATGVASRSTVTAGVAFSSAAGSGELFSIQLMG